MVDLEFFTDVQAWIIGSIIYLLFMFMIWKVGAFGTEWNPSSRMIITILGLPICYIFGKFGLDRGR